MTNESALLEKKLIGTKISNALIDVPDFPKPGILFKDVAPIFAQPFLCREILAHWANVFAETNADAIIGLESRGFLLGMPLAMQLEIPFIMVRKKGKLPGKTISISYDLEYGSSVLELQENALPKGSKIIVHDDVLATGGTARAAADLVTKSGSHVVAFSFLISLEQLGGNKKLQSFGVPLHIFAEF